MGQETYPRHMISLVEGALGFFRGIYILGPRQVGKTTLVHNLLGKGKYITLGRADILDEIETDPLIHLEELRVEAGAEPVIIDEFQRSKELVLPLKRVIDSDKSRGQFILAGSFNVLTTRGSPDSLVGRVVPLQLWPLTIAEIKQKPPNHLLDWMLQKSPDLKQIDHLEALTRKEYINLILEGGFPEPRMLPLQERQNHYRKFIDKIIDSDVSDVVPIRKKNLFRQLLEQVAIRTAKEINRVELANSIGLRWETVDSYLEVMKKLMLVIEVDAWTSSDAKREIKQPKFHFLDTGLNCALQSFNENSFKLGSPSVKQLNGLLESFVFNELCRMLPYQSKDYCLYHWRSADRREIDIIAEGNDQLVGIKVKAASSIRLVDFKHLKWFAKKGPGKSQQFTGIVFYLGDMKLSFGDNCFALPVSTLWAEIGV